MMISNTVPSSDSEYEWNKQEATTGLLCGIQITSFLPLILEL